jgi:indole-3-glycerol phosphate synthase/phosphoribosylanthranilate isomerase/anthranilate synthase/indole-3-glycerol phosphate synthase/phosphoribosylanthranilate isomerase
MAEAILERIIATTRTDLAETKERIPLNALRAQAAQAPTPRPFANALRPITGNPARLIGEIKRASPSKGVIAESFNPIAQAKAYERGGAAAISVLTEPHFFQGSLEHLRAIREAVTLPVLRKDFIFDAYQVYEARAAGADALLLIVALLENATLRELLTLTRELGMEALVEAHDADEVRRAVAVGSSVIGVNSRDLRTFGLETAIVENLRPLVPRDRVFVAESGIQNQVDATRARAWGADAILVGEALMRADAPETLTGSLATAPGGGSIAEFFEFKRRPFVKICGIVTPEQAIFAHEHWVSALGLVFAPMAPDHRRVTVDQAATIMAATFYGEGVQGYIGVFVNESAQTIAAIVDTLHLDAVQLSGDETPDECAQVAAITGRAVLKALRPRTEPDLARLDEYALTGAIICLDTPKDGVYGGTGETGDWALAREAARRWPVILSGGLTPDNIADALNAIHPRGVDVSSGVETNKEKDLDKIARFIAAAQSANDKGREQVGA